MRTRIIIIGFIIVVLLGVLAIVVIPKLMGTDQSADKAYWPTQEWRTSTPEEQGFDSAKLIEALQAIDDQNIQIDSLLIIRNGKVVLDAYFYPYDNSIPHKLASVTKSFTTTLIGIAVDQGLIQLDQPMLSFFQDRTIANLDDWKKSITIKDLVSMRNGFESGCIHGDEPTLNTMRATSDWVQAALDRKMVHEPGTIFCYDSPGMHILSAILKQASGMTEFEFAKKYLFEPLGINEVYWQADPQGYSHGWGDLSLKPLDAAKLGYLWLNNGVWEGKQIISAEWVQDAVKPLSSTAPDNYGYGWWVSNDNYYALGRGGQNIKVYPAYNIIIVTTASNFDYDQISQYIDASFVDSENALSPNPESNKSLNTFVAGATEAAHAWQTGPLPAMAKAISGKTFIFEDNPVRLANFRLEFPSNKEATLYLNLEGKDMVWTIGLDGRYHADPNGRGLRGYWADGETFELEIFEIGVKTYHLQFDGDRVLFSGPGVKFEGQVGTP